MAGALRTEFPSPRELHDFLEAATFGRPDVRAIRTRGCSAFGYLPESLQNAIVSRNPERQAAAIDMANAALLNAVATLLGLPPSLTEEATWEERKGLCRKMKKQLKADPTYVRKPNPRGDNRRKRTKEAEPERSYDHRAHSPRTKGRNRYR